MVRLFNIKQKRRRKLLLFWGKLGYYAERKHMFSTVKMTNGNFSEMQNQ